MKVLVAIANYGTKNSKYLDVLLNEYRSMSNYQVDIIVLSNIPKALGADIQVIVGLPEKDPWSLPFGHKKLFAEKLKEYDLFIYSEDDTLITQNNIESYIEVTNILPTRFIAGFLRYELSPEGKKYYSTIHGHYHWDPKSVIKIDNHIFAHYTNDHSASFIVTQNQLKKAIDSGGFLLPPRKGRYDMLVTAATDPYTQCGMKKLICLTRLSNFELHHLPNVYCGKMGQEAEYVEKEIEILKEIAGNDSLCESLFDIDTLPEDDTWNKRYYQSARDQVIELIPKEARKVLSVGMGCGSTEKEIMRKNIDVFGIPLDYVMRETASAKGVIVTPPNIGSAVEHLKNVTFDCMIFQDILQYLQDPVDKIKTLLPLLDKNGSIIISIPNIRHPSIIYKRIQDILKSIRDTGMQDDKKRNIHFTTRRMLQNWIESCNLQVIKEMYYVEGRWERISRMTFGLFDRTIQRDHYVLCKIKHL